jgi:hypothetical protein
LKSVKPYAAASHHRAQVLRSSTCGCFHCLSTFSPMSITHWVDDGTTALCPVCGVNAVIGSDSGSLITRELLEELQHQWLD